VVEDPGSQSDTEDVPDALAAFQAERPAREDESVVVSRAAALLSLVRPRDTAPEDYRLATEETREVLRVEPVEPFGAELSTELEKLGEPGARAAPGMRDTVAAAQADAATELFSAGAAERAAPRPDATARLIAASLLDDDPLVRVGAAAAALRVDRRNPTAEAILGDAARGSSEIAVLSRAVLTNDRQSDTRVVQIEYPAASPDPDADATLIHGTWARRGRWWQPDGSLFEYLRDETKLFPHLYRGPDPFKWSGYFSFRPKLEKDWSRQQAADSLAWWTQRRLKPDPDLIGHSYGGSLSMMATQSEKRVRGMVLLSPAVHRTCLPDPANYEQVLHVRMKLDLVLLADVSKPALLNSLPRVKERRLRRRGLTGHSTTHDPEVWRRSGLSDYVRDEWLPMLGPRA
jgi:pimeloyl-ACP methyl ester carboxylesterase